MKTFTRLRWLTFLWLVIGYALLHGVAAAWLESNFETRMRPDLDVYFIGMKGELVHQNHLHRDQTVVYMDEENNVLPAVDYNQTLHMSLVSLNSTGNNNYYTRESVAFNDGKMQRTYWYVTAQSDTPDGMYFLLYSEDSNRLIGYVGKEGFSQQIPTPENRFKYSENEFVPMRQQLQQVGLNMIIRNGATEPTEHLNPTYAGIEGVIWVAEKSTIYRVDLKTHVVTKVVADETVRGISIQMQPYIDEKNDTTYPVSIMLLYDDKIRLLNADGTENNVVNIPLEARGMEHYSIGKLFDGRLVLKTSAVEPATKDTRTDFWWLDKEQKLTRHVTKVQKNMSGADYGDTISVSLMVPVAFAALFILILGPVLEQLFISNAESLSSQYASMWPEAFMWLGFTIVVGLVVAWVAARREQRYFGKARLGWVVAVGLFGWPGLLAYWFHREWPSLAPSGKPLALPAEPVKPTGTEIFAYG